MNRNQLKRRTKQGFHRRQVGVREMRQRFLIVCEGERTEPNYFKAFPVPVDVHIHVHGAADNTVNVVQKAIEQRAYGDYDQVWCVFDRDSFPLRHFNAAFSLARKHNIKIAYSNEAFELWYLLHFHYYNTGITRKDYCTHLDRLLGRKYEKGHRTIYQELEARQADAIRNAKTLLASYPRMRPAHDNPSTTVHLLVEELNRFRRP
jgi:hypothetical protein